MAKMYRSLRGFFGASRRVIGDSRCALSENYSRHLLQHIGWLHGTLVDEDTMNMLL